MKKKFIIGIVIIIFFVIVLNVKKNSMTSTPVMVPETAMPTTKFPIVSLENPAIKDGAFFTNAKWNDPSVILVDEKFIMYASAGKGFSGDIDIYRLESNDGIIWKLQPEYPVIENSTKMSAPDKKAVETPSIVILNGIYHMFYTGYPKNLADSKSYRIMHATSNNGITWIKDPNIIVSPTDPTNDTPNFDFNQWITAEPGAVVFDNKIYLYFTAIGANTITQSDLATIGLITSSDGKTWSKPQMVLMPDQTLYPRKTYRGFSTPAATVHNGKIELFFDIVKSDPWEQVAISRAISPDGITNWTLDPLPILTNKTYAWASTEINGPAPLYVNNKLYLWFAGHTGYDLGIGFYREP